MKFSKPLLLLFVLITCKIFLYGQKIPELTLRNLTEKDGLSHPVVNCITQDANGIIWAGTKNGISRYDGKRIKVFYGIQQDSTTLSLGDVRHMLPSGNGLWIASQYHLFYLDISEEKFYHVAAILNPVFARLKNKNCVIASGKIYDLPGESQLKKFLQQKDSLPARSNITVPYYNLCNGSNDQSWGYNTRAIYLLNADHSPAKTFPMDDYLVQSVFCDNQNRYWVASWGKGILLFDPLTGKLTQLKTPVSNGVAFGFTRWKPGDTEYIVVCNEFSVLLINTTTLEQKLIKQDKNFVSYYAYIDKENNCWLATSEGLKIISAKQGLFETIAVNKDEKDVAVTSGHVYSITETLNSFWISKRYNAGIFQFDKQWHLKKYYANFNASDTMFTSEGYDFREDNNDMYITTERGIYKLAPGRSPFFLEGTNAGENMIRLRNIEPLNDSMWWIRSYSKGIFLYNKNSRQMVKNYRLLFDNIPEPIHYMLRTRNGKILITTYKGLFEMDPQTGTFTALGIAGAPSTYMLGMAEDHNGIIWIASAAGLFGVDINSRKIVSDFSDHNEMGSCLRVCVDDYNNVWFNCQKGYWCWIQKKQQMVKLNYDMGLPDNRIESAFTRGSNGFIYAGAENAVVKFNPQLIMNYNVDAAAYITDIVVNKEWSKATVVNDSSRSLQLRPGHYTISISFSVTDFSTPVAYDLYYQTTPGDGNWTATQSGNFTFHDLPHGEYTIAVKGKNNLNGQFSKPYYLQLSIKPFWYQALWFKILMMVASIAVISWLTKRRVTKVKAEAALKEKIYRSEMQALRAQMNPHFIFNTLNSIENFIMQNEKRLASDYLNKFARLIRMILDSSRMELVPLTLDMEALQLYIDLEKLRLNHKFSYSIVMDDDLQNGDYKIPSLLIQPYVENAILHGLAQSEATALQLIITVQLRDDSILFTITDNGIGRAQSALYKSKNKPYHKSVGMEINKERILRFNKKVPPGDAVKTTDLFDVTNTASGTKIEILIDAL